MAATKVLHEQVHVERPVHEVFSYASDFGKCEEWDPGVSSARRLTEGRIGVGTRYRVICAVGPIRLPLQYEVIEWQADKKVVLEGQCPFFTVTDTIVFSATAADATRIDYTAAFVFKHGLGAIAGAFDQSLDKIGKDAVAGLRTALQNDFAVSETSTGKRLADKFVLPGVALFTRAGYHLTKSNWHPLTSYLGDKHIVLTGATSGLGLAAAQRLATMEAHLTLVARNAEKAQNVADQIKRDTGNTNIHVEIADLSLMREVNALADRLLERKQTIDVLINNAGALINPRQTTAEGLEKSFALLLLCPFILTERLQPLLKNADDGRVVNVVSGGMYTQKLDVDDLQNKQGKYSGSTAYAKAKRALVVLTEQWAAQWDKDGIVVNAMHPGWADTPGVESSLPVFHKFTRPLLRTPEEGADTIVWLAAAEEAGDVSGQFFLDREAHTTHVLANTEETQTERTLLQEKLLEYKQSFAPVSAAKTKTRSPKKAAG